MNFEKIILVITIMLLFWVGFIVYHEYDSHTISSIPADSQTVVKSKYEIENPIYNYNLGSFFREINFSYPYKSDSVTKKWAIQIRDDSICGFDIKTISIDGNNVIYEIVISFTDESYSFKTALEEKLNNKYSKVDSSFFNDNVFKFGTERTKTMTIDLDSVGSTWITYSHDFLKEEVERRYEKIRIDKQEEVKNNL